MDVLPNIAQAREAKYTTAWAETVSSFERCGPSARLLLWSCSLPPEIGLLPGYPAPQEVGDRPWPV